MAFIQETVNKIAGKAGLSDPLATKTIIEFLSREDNSGNQIQQSMIIDATVTESHISEAKPTDHPVEQGADISDHITISNDTLNMDGLIVEFPLDTTASLKGFASARTRRSTRPSSPTRSACRSATTSSRS